MDRRHTRQSRKMPDCRSATINSDTQRQSSGSKKNLADLNDRHDHDFATGRRFKARLPPFSSRLSRYNFSKIRIRVSCPRAGLAALLSRSLSSSVVHRPNFGRAWTLSSYSNDVSPDRNTLRTVFRDTPRSRAICPPAALLVPPSHTIERAYRTRQFPANCSAV
jgi:hypothetical protein